MQVTERAALACALASLAIFAAGPAGAETITAELRAGLRSSIDMKLTGRIEARCLLSGGGAIDLGELGGGEGAQANLGLDCNVPFDIDIRSARGGLAHAEQPLGEGPYSGLLEYDLRLTVPTLRPTPGVAQASYSSRQLVAAQTLSSGEGIAAGGGSLEFRTRRPEGAGLLAGRYSETITLTVSPRM